MDKLRCGSFPLSTCRGSVPRRNRTSPASGTSVGWQPTGRLKLGLNAVRPKVQRGRRWCSATLGCAVCAWAWPKESPRRVSTGRTTLGSASSLLHRSQGGTSSASPIHSRFGSQFLSRAGSNRRKDAEGPEVLAALKLWKSGGARHAEGAWCAEGARRTEGAMKRITASSPAS